MIEIINISDFEKTIEKGMPCNKVVIELNETPEPDWTNFFSQSFILLRNEYSPPVNHRIIGNIIEIFIRKDFTNKERLRTTYEHLVQRTNDRQ